jgi:hypothetical protein
VRSEGFQRPIITGLVVAENVGVSIVGYDSEVHRVRAVPLVLDRRHEPSLIAEPEFCRAFVCFAPTEAFNSNSHREIFARKTSRYKEE